jgi:hypothetical protein
VTESHKKDLNATMKLPMRKTKFRMRLTTQGKCCEEGSKNLKEKIGEE